MKRHGGHPLFLAAAIVLAAHGLSLAQQAELNARLAQPDDVEIVRARAFSIIAHSYVDSVRIDSSLPLAKIVSGLDPFSCYLTQEEYKESMRGNYGVELRYGVLICSADGRVIFAAVTRHSAADDAGFLPGDELLSIDGQDLNGNDSIARYLFCKKEALTLKLYRESADSTWTVNIHKSVCEQSSVPVASMFDSNVGYIAITGFDKGTASKLGDALQRLHVLGMTSLILDLRSNPGGFVDEAISALNLFIQTDSPVIRIVSRNVDYEKGQALPDPAAYPALPLAILVSNNTCSAAEIFCGVMQDLDRAIIVGQPTTGKSLVMRYFGLTNGDELYLAMARYTLPSGRLVERPYRNGVLIGGDDRDYGSFDNSRHYVDSDLSEEGCHTFKAADGRSMIALCGIVPDYFVSQELFYPEWLKKSLVGAAALYLRVRIKSLLTMQLDSFECRPMAPVLVNWVLDQIRAHDTTADKLLSPQLAWMAPTLIKAYVAYAVWGDYGFYRLWDRNSACVRRAVELLSKPPVLAALGKE